MSWKKIALTLLGVLVVAVIAAGTYWELNKDRLQQEYQAYRKTGAPVLMYHGVGPEKKGWPKSLLMDPVLFESHIKYLKEQGYTIISVEELAHRLEQNKTVDKYVALSFDDGYKNNHDIVLPILKKYDAKGSFFVINNKIGHSDHMDEADIQDMINNGMELGSHTYSHGALAKSHSKYLVWELDTSRFWLKKKFNGYIVRTLAYPNGNYNQEVIDAAKKYGFYRALTGHIGLNTAETYKKAPMEMFRVTVADDRNGLEGFKNRLEQAYFFGFLQTKGININPIRDIFVE